MNTTKHLDHCSSPRLLAVARPGRAAANAPRLDPADSRWAATRSCRSRRTSSCRRCRCRTASAGRATRIPTVASGLKIEKIADGLHASAPAAGAAQRRRAGRRVERPGHRSGDDAQAARSPAWSRAARARAARAATASRCCASTPATGEWEQHVFLEHLHSPFGVQLIGRTLYVADTDSDHEVRLRRRGRRDHRPGHRAGRPARAPSTTTGPRRCSRAPTARSSTSASAPTATSPRTAWRSNTAAPPCWRSTWPPAPAASSPRACATRPGLQWEPQTGKLWAIVNERDEIGADLVPDYLTSVQEGGFYGWPYSYYGQHVDERVKPQRPDLVAKAIKPDYALGLARRAAGPAVLHRQQPAGRLPRRRLHRRARQLGPLAAERLQGELSCRFVDGRPDRAGAAGRHRLHSADEKSLFGAPVGLAQGADGALLIADDVGNAVWSVTASGS